MEPLKGKPREVDVVQLAVVSVHGPTEAAPEMDVAVERMHLMAMPMPHGQPPHFQASSEPWV